MRSVHICLYPECCKQAHEKECVVNLRVRYLPASRLMGSLASPGEDSLLSSLAGTFSASSTIASQFGLSQGKGTASDNFTTSWFSYSGSFEDICALPPICCQYLVQGSLPTSHLDSCLSPSVASWLSFPSFQCFPSFHAIIYQSTYSSIIDWSPGVCISTCWTKSKWPSLVLKAVHHPTSSLFPQHRLHLLHPSLQSPCPQFCEQVVTMSLLPLPVFPVPTC